MPRTKSKPVRATTDPRVEAVALASQMVLDWLEKHGVGWTDHGAANMLEEMHELVILARTREGAAADLRMSIAEEQSIGVAVRLLKYLPELPHRTRSCGTVDIPGGAAMSRVVH